MRPQLKVEFFLPSSYNSGEDIEPKKIFFVKKEILAAFGGISTHPASVAGIWQGEDKVYYNNCYRFEVAAPKTDQTKEFFILFKEKLKELFEQHEIYMTSVEMERF